MNLKEIGFPYKQYRTKWINERFQSLLTYSQDHVVEANDHYVKLQEAYSKSKPNRKGIFGSYNYRNEKQNETEILLQENGYLETSTDLSLHDYFRTSDYGDGLMEDYRFHFETVFNEEVYNRLVTSSLKGSITLIREFPIHSLTMKTLKDQFGSKIAAENPSSYIKKYPAYFSHTDSLSLDVTYSVEQENNTKSYQPFPLRKETFSMRKMMNQSYCGVHLEEDLETYQELRKVLLTNDMKQIQAFLFQRVERSDIDLTVSLSKRGFLERDAILTSQFGIARDEPLHGTYSKMHYTNADTNDLITDDMALKELGLKNFSVEENGERIQGNVIKKLYDPLHSIHSNRR